MKHTGFLKKEIREIFRTNKIYILPAVFLFIGLTSPLSTKLMPEILKALGGESGGYKIEMSRVPGYLDAFGQYFKNLTQMGIIVMIFVFMGMVVDEKIKGTVILVLTKCVSRGQFIISKFISGVMLFTFSYILSVLACILYTNLLFEGFHNDNLIPTFLIFWVYGVFIISITVFASTISKSSVVSALISFTGFFLFVALAAIPHIGKYTPGILGGLSMGVLAGTNPTADSISPVIVSLLISILFVFCSVSVFKKQEL